MEAKRATNRKAGASDQPQDGSTTRYNDGVGAWRKGRNQDLVRDAHALSGMAKQSKEEVTKTRQLWLAQRAKYESHVLYEARRQLALLSGDARPKHVGIPTKAAKPTHSVSMKDTSQHHVNASERQQTLSSCDLSPAPLTADCSDRLRHDSQSVHPQVTQPSESAQLGKEDTLDGLGEAIARIESLMKSYTKPLSGSISGAASASARNHTMKTPMGGKPHPREDFLLSSHGPRSFGPGSVAGNALDASTANRVGQDRFQEKPPGLEVETSERPLSSSWRDMGELGSHDLMSLISSNRKRS